MVEAEVQRINSTTRAPEMLAEIKAALGHDPIRFADAFARPVLVERLLRDKFENDEALHAAIRRECERVRSALLSARNNGANPAQLLAQLKQANPNAVMETSWQLGKRPVETSAPTAEEIEIKQRFGASAQMLSAPRGIAREGQILFPGAAGRTAEPAAGAVAPARRRERGDRDARGFRLYVASQTSEQTLSTACLSLLKRNYEEWLTKTNCDPCEARKLRICGYSA